MDVSPLLYKELHLHYPLILNRGVGCKIRKVGSFAMIAGSKSNEAGCNPLIVGSNAPCLDERIRSVTDLVDLQRPEPQIK